MAATNVLHKIRQSLCLNVRYMNLLIPGDIRSGKVLSRVLHNAVLPRSDTREYIVYKVFTKQDVSQLDSDFVLQSPSPPTHINPYQPIS